jgi:hypothetical protein
MKSMLFCILYSIVLMGCETNADSPGSPEKAITEFYLKQAGGGVFEGVIREPEKTVTFTVPHGAVAAELIPQITHTGIRVRPENGVLQEFSGPVVYTVTAEDGSIQEYTVTVTITANTAKSITQCEIEYQEGRFALGDIQEDRIAVTVPYGAGVTFLVPHITHTGVRLDPPNEQPRNFSGPVLYTVIAEDGSFREYTVTVQAAPSDAKVINAFTIGTSTGMISGESITVTVPFGTNVTALTPQVTFLGVSIIPPVGPRDFTGPVTYRVIADDGSTKDYTVVVRHAPSGEKAIASFMIGNTLGVITESAITVTLPYGTDSARLTPVILYTGSSVSPASGVEKDFTNPVVYRVTAGDGSTRDYTVTVRLEGRAPVMVTFAPLANQEIDLTAGDGSTGNNLSRKIKDTLEIAVSEGDSPPVRWFVDGEELSGTAGTITLGAVDFPLGKHHVTALVYRGGIPFSGELLFRVVE